jgi:GntR family transcriptional regulator
MADPPLYRQIADNLRHKIESGELAPGTQLPTELELREQYGNASRNTIRDAIKSLIAQRLVSTHPGRGTFVLETIDPFIVRLHTPLESRTFIEAAAQQERTATASEPRVEIQNARPDVAQELQIQEGSQVVVRHQQRFIDGSPSSLQTSFYPMEFVQQGATDLLLPLDIEQGATSYIEAKLGITQAGTRDRLRVRSPNPGEVGFFRLTDAGSQLVVETRRTAYADDLKLIRYTVTVYAADRNQFIIDTGKVPPLSELKGKS